MVEELSGWELVLVSELEANLFELLSLLIEPRGKRARQQVFMQLDKV